MNRKPTRGSIIRINLDNQHHGYGQVLTDGSIAFFNLFEPAISDLNTILTREVIFIIRPYNHAFRSENWELLGKADIRNDLLVVPNKFIQDQLNPKLFEIYNPNTGEISKAFKEDCLGLERSAVWEANHIEERLLDFYNGTENHWEKSLRIK